MRQEEFEPAIPASERPQAYALDHVATGIGAIEFSLIHYFKMG
jgi:hypothetical protein